MTKTDLQILREARELIAQGWTQGAYRRGGCYCTMGALYRAIPWSEYRAAGKDDERIVELLGFDTRYSLVKWNDVPGQTQGGVLERFDRAIREMEGQEA